MNPMLVCLVLTAISISSCKKPEAIAPSANGETNGSILFLGDGFTHSGEFITYLDAVSFANKKSPSTELINLGLPWENCSGLNESDRKFPRPNIQDRIDRALEIVKPDKVFVCYGTTDGVFSPFSEERFAAFQNGINAIIEKVHAANAKLILMTPPPFDMERNRTKNGLRPAGAERFGYFEVYENYDREVIEKYSEWLLQQSSRVEGVINLRPALLSYLEERRRAEPAYTFLGNGAILDLGAHKVVAKTILSFQGDDPAQVDSLWRWHLVRSEKRQEILHPAWLSHVGYTLSRQPKNLPLGIPLEDAREAAYNAGALMEWEYKNKRAESNHLPKVQ